MSDCPYFKIHQNQDVCVLKLQELGGDRAVVNAFGQALLAYVAEQRPQRLVVNLAAVKQLSSPALAKLMMAEKQVKRYGGSFRVCELTTAVGQVLSLAWPSQAGSEAGPLTEPEAVEQLKNWKPD